MFDFVAGSRTPKVVSVSFRRLKTISTLSSDKLPLSSSDISLAASFWANFNQILSLSSLLLSLSLSLHVDCIRVENSGHFPSSSSSNVHKFYDQKRLHSS
jgi:hypothetical protein